MWSPPDFEKWPPPSACKGLDDADHELRYTRRASLSVRVWSALVLYNTVLIDRALPLFYSTVIAIQQLHCNLDVMTRSGEPILKECQPVIEKDIPLLLQEGDWLFSEKSWGVCISCSQKGGDDEKKEDVSSHFSFDPVSAFMRYNAANNNQGRAWHCPRCEVVRSCMHLRGDWRQDTGYPGKNWRCIRGKGWCE
jgi:hypothetical protein